MNKTKKIKLDNILSESDSVHEIDSMEEESLTKGIKYSNKNLKGIHNMKSDSLNYKRHLTTGMNNPNNKNSEISMKDSINKILEYSDDITLYPGHGDITTLGYEKENNSYLK